METTNTQPATPTEETGKKPSFLARYKFTIISLCIILLALVPLIIISRNNKKPTELTQIQVTPTPTIVPLTQENAVPTLDAVDTKIQTALNQSDQAIQAANQVDSSQDSTAGL